MTNTFTGVEFAKRLSEGKLKQPIVKIGMVKKDDADPKTILFAEGTACGDWISIPVSLIEEATFLGNTRCHDHEHALTRIELKDPPADNEAARTYAEFARRSGPGPAVSLGAVAPTGAAPAGVHAHASGGCAGSNHGGPPGVMEQRAGGLGGLGGNGLTCIAWHTECRWIDLWISSLNTSIPIFVCYTVCDRVMF